MFQKGLALGLSTFVVISMAACIQNKTEKVVTEQLAPQQIEKSFQVKDQEKASLRMQKSSLGKLFLLRATMKNLKSAPAWEDLKPMIVSFQKTGDHMGMFEMDTYSTYDVIDTKRLVSEFKVIAESETDIQFEWGEGLKIVPRPFYDDATGADDSSQLDSHEGQSPSVETVASFVKAFDINNNQLHVRQALRAKMSMVRMKAENPLKPSEKSPVFETKEIAAEVDYVLKPYMVNPHFQPKEADSLRRVGFFKTTVGQDTKSESKTAYAAHWDLSPEAGPITFAITKNFPPEILSAIKEGVLYWNFVLGADKIKVIDNFEPESDFPDRTVVVNWLPWTDAGASWANFQTDPLTGEILRGQIYITSVFLNLSHIFPTSEEEPQLSLSGMTSGRACTYPIQTLSATTGATGSKKAQYVADILRHVVAHEAGHTLGMRHNFAGSMDSALKVAEINLEKQKYETDLNYQGAELTSTIMDYIQGLEEGMIGRWIKFKPLGYDKDALSWVNSNQVEVKTKYSFCTDDDIFNATLHMEKLFGCERFDTPANPFSIRKEEISRATAHLVEIKFNNLLKMMYPAGSTEVRELEAVLSQDYKKNSASLLGNGGGISSLIETPLSYIYDQTGGPYSLSVVYFKNKIDLRWDATSTDLNGVLKQQLLEVGGIAPLLKAIVPLDDQGNYIPNYYSKQLVALKSSSKFSRGLTEDGRSYELNEEQKARLAQYLQKGAEKMETDTLGALTQLKPYSDVELPLDGKTLKISKSVRSGIGQDQWYPDLAKFFKMMILAPGDLKTETLNGQDISYRSSAVGFSQRVALAGLMSPSDWKASVSKTEASEVQKELISKFRALYLQLNLPPELVPPESDKAEDHEAFLKKLSEQSKIPSSIYSIVTEDLSVLKKLEEIK